MERESAESEVGPSQTSQNPFHLTITEMEVPLCDQSVKRHAEDSDEEERKQRKALKKRRSSLSTKRRSIVMGDLPLDPQSSDTGSQESCPSSGDPLTSSQGSQEKRLKPNPANLKMDALIRLMQVQIKKLNKEHDEWQEILDHHIEKEKESKALTSNLSLPESSISEDVKQVAQNFITNKPLDLKAAKEQITQLLADYQFDREVCCQDLSLIKTCAETLHHSNKALSSHLEQAMEDKNSNAEDEEAAEKSTFHKQNKRLKSDPVDVVPKVIPSC